MTTITAESLKELINSYLKRDRQLKGLYRRYILQSASTEEWIDPRSADGVPILARKQVGKATVNQRLHIPFDRMITNAKASYFASNVKTIFDDTIPQLVLDTYEYIDDRSNMDGLYIESAESCADRGTSYLLLFNTGGKIGIASSHEWSSKVLYDPLTKVPTLGLRYTEDEVEVYGGQQVTFFNRDNDGNLMQVDSQPHGFGTEANPGIPLIELPNNVDRIGNVEMSLSLQDAYDVCMSDLSSEVAQMRLAYLLLKGLGNDQGKIKESLKKTGVLILDSGDGDAKFITKDLKVDAIKLLIETLREQIFEGSASYDPNGFTEGASPTAYQVAQRLHPLEQDSQRTIGIWVKHLNYLDYLIKNFLTIFHSVASYSTGEIQRVFVRNIPENVLGQLKEAKTAGLEIANELLLEMSGLDVDIEQNKQLLQGEVIGA